MQCDYCEGKGTIIPFVGEAQKCPKCGGSGRTEVADPDFIAGPDEIYQDPLSMLRKINIPDESSLIRNVRDKQAMFAAMYGHVATNISMPTMVDVINLLIRVENRMANDIQYLGYMGAHLESRKVLDEVTQMIGRLRAMNRSENRVYRVRPPTPADIKLESEMATFYNSNLGVTDASSNRKSSGNDGSKS